MFDEFDQKWFVRNHHNGTVSFQSARIGKFIYSTTKGDLFLKHLYNFSIGTLRWFLIPLNETTKTFKIQNAETGLYAFAYKNIFATTKSKNNSIYQNFIIIDN